MPGTFQVSGTQSGTLQTRLAGEACPFGGGELMPGRDVLYSIAEVSITLVGFSAIYRPQAGQSDKEPVERQYRFDGRPADRLLGQASPHLTSRPPPEDS